MKTIVKDDFPNTDFKVGDLGKSEQGTILKVTSIDRENTFSGIILHSEKRPYAEFQEEAGWAIRKFKRFNGEIIFKN